MRKILLLSAAIAAVLAGPAMAQRTDRGGDHNGGQRDGGRPPGGCPCVTRAPDRACPPARAGAPGGPRHPGRCWTPVDAT